MNEIAFTPQVLNLLQKLDEDFYLIDGKKITESFESLKNSLPDNFNILYSVKANPNSRIIRILSESKSMFDICSLSELSLCLENNIGPELISVTGPAKSKHELDEYLKHEVHQINVENLEELDYVLANKKFRTKIFLRINLSYFTHHFGFSTEDTYEILKNHHKEISGLHLYYKSQILDEKLIKEHFKNCATFIKSLPADWIGHFYAINLGSGLGIPYFEGERELNLKSVFDGFNDYFSDIQFNKPVSYQIESGRYLVGRSGKYFCKVLSIKKIKDRQIYITNGGIHHAMILGCPFMIIKKNFNFSTSKDLAQKEYDIATIIGKTCFSEDILARDAKLPKLEKNDWIAFHNMGSYGESFSPVGFNGFAKLKTYFLQDL